jgi:DNA-binding transcriptional ArsR family regulator
MARGGKPTSRGVSSAQLDRIFRCLGDSNRRRILALLRESGELKVGAIAAAFPMSLNGVSKHLKVLESAGLVQRRIEGREHWIGVNWQGLEAAYGWLHIHYHYWAERLEVLAAIAPDLDPNDPGNSDAD